MPKARRVGHRRRRPSAYEQAGLAKVTGDGPFLRNVSIFGTAFKGVVACNKSSTRLIAASKPLRCTSENGRALGTAPTLYRNCIARMRVEIDTVYSRTSDGQRGSVLPRWCDHPALGPERQLAASITRAAARRSARAK